MQVERQMNIAGFDGNENVCEHEWRREVFCYNSYLSGNKQRE